jgi:CRP/FNR family cyclic AMP-dependent transcriptional regulator
MSEETLTYLKQIPPFKDLSDETFDRIADTVEDVHFPSNTVIITAGDEGDSLYIIKKGTVEVYVQSGDENEKIVLSQLGENDYFGEMALITGEPRSATVATLEEVECLRLAKSGFDQIIKENPSISLSLSHMLSQRLKNANLQRAKSESLFHERVTPSGELKDTSFWELLKFCEQNSLTGVLKVEHGEDNAQIYFEKGNVQEVVLGNLTEAEAMDALMQWNKGHFIIEPAIFSLEKQTEKKEGSEGDKIDFTILIENLLIQSFEKLRSAVGSQVLKDIVRNSRDQLIPYFQDLKSWKFEVLPSVRVEIKQNSKEWSDKETLAIAVFLQTVIKNCTPYVVGISYLNLKNLAGSSVNQLDKISFFDYMAHADEFAV